MLMELSQGEIDALGRDACRTQVPQFHALLVRNGSIAEGADRATELEHYLLRGWDAGLRLPADLVRYAAACLRAGGDVGEVASLRALLAEHAGAPEGVMQRLLVALPAGYWNALADKLPAQARWEEEQQ